MKMCVCMRERERECVNGMNLKLYAVRWHIHIAVHSVLCQHYTQAHTHTHKHIFTQFEDSELTGLKVDIAVKSVSLGVC